MRGFLLFFRHDGINLHRGCYSPGLIINGSMGKNRLHLPLGRLSCLVQGSVSGRFDSIITMTALSVVSDLLLSSLRVSTLLSKMYKSGSPYGKPHITRPLRCLHWFLVIFSTAPFCKDSNVTSDFYAISPCPDHWPPASIYISLSLFPVVTTKFTPSLPVGAHQNRSLITAANILLANL
ncbi:hypothetical protein ARMSODRAFT_655309 [Armillaria solidipes]|uniref:Uncharacterized protein n=1 Tax=Armillaria solidipes TaxID=1076256 RepID=A0A2H3BEY0_9AGAR|nr:hypothetical protein ARMSODRAFT_655309 [Armillaria solidipes]